MCHQLFSVASARVRISWIRLNCCRRRKKRRYMAAAQEWRELSHHVTHLFSQLWVTTVDEGGLLLEATWLRRFRAAKLSVLCTAWLVNIDRRWIDWSFGGGRNWGWTFNALNNRTQPTHQLDFFFSRQDRPMCRIVYMLYAIARPSVPPSVTRLDQSKRLKLGSTPSL